MSVSKTGVWLALALGISGAMVAALIWFTSGKAGGVELTSAALVPEDAAVYLAYNTNLKSPQWVAAFGLVERLGTEDPEGQLREEAESEGGLDWEEDVQPFLGGNAAVYMSSFDVETFAVTGAVIAKVNDGQRAMEVIEQESGLEFAEGTYLGVGYRSSSDGLMWIAVIDGHLVAAMNEESLRDVIEVADGRQPSLASNGDFVALRDELETNFLAFVYLDMESMFNDLAGSDALSEAMAAAGADIVLKPIAGVFGAKSEGFVFQAAGGGDPGATAPMLEPRASRFATLVPADTAVFFTTFGIAGAFEAVLEEARDELDDSLAANTPWRSLDELLRELGEEAGVDSLEQLIGLFDGESAVAAWFPDGDQENIEGVLMTEVGDAGEARDVIESLLEGEDAEFEESNGVATWRSVEDEDMMIALVGTDLYLGTEAGVEAMLAGSGPTLDQAGEYRRALATLPTAAGTYLFVDMGTVLRLAEGGIPAELDEVEEALEALIVNWVQERGIARVNGALTVAPE